MNWHAKARAASALFLAACASPGERPLAGARGAGPAGGAVTGAAPTYRLYVANESSDVVNQVAFTPGVGVRVESATSVGQNIADIDGPHGIAVSPDGKHWYVSIAHGTPYGTVWKYATGTNELKGRVQLGLFPATLALTPGGDFLYVVNFNLHGEMEPSSVSVVYAPTMTEVARPTTCVMPHGSRVNEAGTKQYSACMMSEQVVELDTRTFEVTGRFNVMPGMEGPLAANDIEGHGTHSMTDREVCSPTWVQPGAGRWANFVYVPCNKAGEILEIDLASQQVTRRFPTGAGPYNLAVTPDGTLLVATLKGAQGVAVIDLSTGLEAKRIETSEPIVHGVVVSPDGRYAFVTNEAIGSTRGTMDVIDLGALERVASVALEYQTGGIDFWSMTP